MGDKAKQQNQHNSITNFNTFQLKKQQHKNKVLTHSQKAKYRKIYCQGKNIRKYIKIYKKDISKQKQL